MVTGLFARPVELYEPPAPVTASSTIPLPVPVTTRFSLTGHTTVSVAEFGKPPPDGPTLVVVVMTVVVVVVVDVVVVVGVGRFPLRGGWLRVVVG